MEELRPDGEPADPQSAEPILCPHCGLAVDHASIAGPVAQCTNCGAQFFSPDPQNAGRNSDGEPTGESTDSTREEELSAMRIKQMSALRRTAYRTRSYFIVGVITCVAVAINLVYYAFNETKARHRFTVYTGLYISLALAAFIGAWKFWSRAMQIHRDIQVAIKARELEELEISKEERDFSALSDGSHLARNLEQIYDPRDDCTPSP